MAHANYLRSLGYEAVSAGQVGLGKDKDITIAYYALETGYTVLTLDLDFGKIYHFGIVKQLIVVVLRLRDQRAKAINKVLFEFLATSIITRKESPHSLIIVSESGIRVNKK